MKIKCNVTVENDYKIVKNWVDWSEIAVYTLISNCCVCHLMYPCKRMLICWLCFTRHSEDPATSCMLSVDMYGVLISCWWL